MSMRAMLLAFSFLTRLPVPASQASAQDLARSLRFFPLVGAVIGLGLVGAASLIGAALPSQLTAAVLVALSALITGGLHLDGVADLFDGLSGGRGERERALAIMRDSRIGAHGAVALVLCLLLKVFATSELLDRAQLYPVLAAPIGARLSLVPLVRYFRYAREEGLGKAMHEHASNADVVIATLVGITCLAPLGVGITAPSACALAFALLAALHLQRKLGGLTGDVYGAILELSELCVLIGSIVTLK